jgi:hypothetical protein
MSGILTVAPMAVCSVGQRAVCWAG